MQEGNYNINTSIQYDMQNHTMLCIRPIFTRYDYKTLNGQFDTLTFNFTASSFSGNSNYYYLYYIVNNRYGEYNRPSTNIGWCIDTIAEVNNNPTINFSFDDAAGTGGQCGLEIYVA